MFTTIRGRACDRGLPNDRFDEINTDSVCYDPQNDPELHTANMEHVGMKCNWETQPVFEIEFRSEVLSHHLRLPEIKLMNPVCQLLN